MSFTHHQRVTPIAKHVSEFSTPTPPTETATALESGDTPTREEARLRVKQNTSAADT